MDYKSEIRQCLAEILERKGDSRPFADDASIFLGGHLDSIDSVEVLLFLETRFGIKLPTDGSHRARIDTVNAIEALVRESTGGQKTS
jgi:acyl carrier protein